MGIGFTVDSALKVARYGINSVLSLSGQSLHEKLRKFHSEKNGIAYEKITKEVDDYKALRTTIYLNFLDDQVTKTFDNYKNSPLQHKGEIEKYINLSPNSSKLKKEFHSLMETPSEDNKIKNWIETNIEAGSIDVNIMTKLDRDRYAKGEKLPVENNDAHVALRAYANSNLESSIILSAGLNPRLFTYMEGFEDFYPDAKGFIKKKICLKVSDYRSALIQGRFLAKKGLWVSEYRIESGLNCGGHAFATDGLLMGPILDEFKKNKDELLDSVFEILKTALDNKNRPVTKESLPFIFTAQGGVGTSEEHNFLLEEYQLDSVGWGSPFLLVPEASNVDSPTITRLIEANKEDFFLSNTSPLGVPFNTIRGTSKEVEREKRIANGKPGASCIEGNLALFNTEFTSKPICTSSLQYQILKIDQLQREGLEPEVYKKKYNEVVEKTCLCTGLVTSVLLVNGLHTYEGNDGAYICPGPNMLYFKKVMTLSEIIDHIYGRKSIPFPMYRPNMFVQELDAYIDYLNNSIEDSRESITKKEKNRFIKFADNLLVGIDYYYTLFNNNKDAFRTSKSSIISELDASNEKVRELQNKITELTVTII
jgi:hypothetical protein